MVFQKLERRRSFVSLTHYWHAAICGQGVARRSLPRSLLTTDRGLGNPNFGLHPDGKGFAVLKTSGKEQSAVVNKVSFIFNFFDELRRKLPSGTK